MRFVILVMILNHLSVVLSDENLFYDNLEYKFVANFTFDRNRFMLNGQPVRFYAAEMHYFRVPPQYWYDRLNKLRLAGINVVSTPVEWSLHEPHPGQFNFMGEADLEHFIKLARYANLYVIFKIGPFIGAERTFGGLPPWLLYEFPYPGITWLRTEHPLFKKYSERWLSVLLPILQRYLFVNFDESGPILMVQIEQNFGYSKKFKKCDQKYLQNLYKLVKDFLGPNAIIYTQDLWGINDYQLCSLLSNVPYMLSVNPNRVNVTQFWENLEHVSFLEVLINEVIHWNEDPQYSDCSFCEFLNEAFKRNFPVVLNMFVDGTNFGFSAGKSSIKKLGYTTACRTLAPINSIGDPTNDFYNIKHLIGKYNAFRSKGINLTERAEPFKIQVESVGSLLDVVWKTKFHQNSIRMSRPKSFRDLKQSQGFILYEKILESTYGCNGTCFLKSEGVSDRGYVYFRKFFQGFLIRDKFNQVKLSNPRIKDLLQIFVEHTGILSEGFEMNSDVKGIVSNILINNQIVYNWTVYRYPFTSLELIFKHAFIVDKTQIVRRLNPGLFRGTFVLNHSNLQDRYLNMQQWSRGAVFINGKNLGRYWAVAGPQISLFLPGCWLRAYPELNQLIVLELERKPRVFQIEFENSSVFMKKIWLKRNRGTFPKFQTNRNESKINASKAHNIFYTVFLLWLLIIFL